MTMSRLHYGPADGMRGRSVSVSPGVAARGEEAGQVAAGDLAVRPPELDARDAGWRRRAAGATSACVLVEVAAQVQRSLAGQDDAAQDRAGTAAG